MVIAYSLKLTMLSVQVESFVGNIINTTDTETCSVSIYQLIVCVNLGIGFIERRIHRRPEFGRIYYKILFEWLSMINAACIFFAMTASIAIRNRETCMLLFVFTSVPLLFLSGISWPGAAMPAFWKYFSYIFPSTFGINGYVRINSMGATLNEVSFEYQALWIQTGFYFITTCLVYRWQILQSRKHVIEEYKKHKSIEA